MSQHSPAIAAQRRAIPRALAALCGLSWCCAATACGGKAVTESPSSAAPSAGICPATASSAAPDPPSSADCTEFVNGMFRKAACDGVLALSNPSPSPVEVQLMLTFSPLDDPPSLTAEPDVELHIADADASFYGVWSKQVGNGGLFAVTNTGGMTTLRLGIAELALEEVPLAGCETRTTTGSVIAPYGDALYFDMQATLMDRGDKQIAIITGEAYQPRAHSIITDDAGAPRDGGPPD